MQTDFDVADRLTRRQWYDEPSVVDMYADGSSCCRGPSSSNSDLLDPHLVEACLEVDRTLHAITRKIPFNPPAGNLRKKDLHGYWMNQALTLQESDNNKAKTVLQQKRELNLAKQTVAGLRVLGLNYDVTELSIVFRLAYKYCDQRTSEVAQRTDVALALSTLDAALKFDLKKIAGNLGLTIKRPKTFGCLN